MFGNNEPEPSLPLTKVQNVTATTNYSKIGGL
jgi:hypothetical protein